jgi:hypothetical protein
MGAMATRYQGVSFMRNGLRGDVEGLVEPTSYM